ncbi:TPA: CoA:oxalate CoA-transferase, partial [Escherichia coli]
FSWERLQEINPRLIYASSSGFGHTGPLKDAPAYDTIIQAMSGIMMETGYPDAPPVRVGTSLADLCGGVYLFSGIVSALYGREKSQRGAHVDIAMFDATLSFLEHGLMAYIATGKSPQRLGNRHPYMAPFDVFDTQDKPITICCGNDKLFSALCQALELTELVNDPRFSSNILRVHNQAILKEYIERTLKTQVAEVWLARIHEVGVPVAPLLSVAEAINLPQTQARNMLIEAGGIMMPGNPIKISGCADPHVMPGAATLDQHGEQIRQEFSS